MKKEKFRKKHKKMNSSKKTLIMIQWNLLTIVIIWMQNNRNHNEKINFHQAQSLLIKIYLYQQFIKK